MPIQVKCRCGGIYKLPEAWAGRKAHCKKCGSPIRIPSKEPEVLDAEEFEVVENDFEVVEDDFEVVEEEKKPSGAMKKLGNSKAAKPARAKKDDDFEVVDDDFEIANEKAKASDALVKFTEKKKSKPIKQARDEEEEEEPKPKKKKKKRKLTPEQQAVRDEILKEEREHRNQMYMRGFSYLGSGLMVIGLGIGAIIYLVSYREGEVSALPGLVFMVYKVVGPYIPGIVIMLLGLFLVVLGIMNLIGIGIVISPTDEDED